MTQLRMALAQLRCEKGDWAGNLARAAALMALARAAGCDIVVFPEMGLSGYCDPARFPAAVQPLDSPWVQQFVALAARHQIAASGGFIEHNPAGKPFITQVLAQDGRIAHVYRKIHVVEEEAALFAPGTDPAVFTLRLAGGDLLCALAVCADSDRPDLFAAFAAQGARVVFHSSAPGLYTRCADTAAWQAGFAWYHSHLFERLPGYARTHRLFIAVATQTGATVDEDFPGGSFVFGPDGTCLAAAPDYAETLLIHEITVPAAPAASSSGSDSV
jgi:predicted amidohydrolase